MNPRSMLVLVLATVISGCATGAANIAQLKVDPGRFQDKTIRLEGVVTHTPAAARADGSVYKIDDGSGEITVFCASPVVLSRGARVRVTGTLERSTTGGRAVVLHVQERDLDVLPSGN